jgi:F-type H+-transporting ATPase subunit gamma
MSQSLRNIKLRIKGIENTRKITRAMEMVSSAKLNRVRSLLYPSRAYYHRLEKIMRELASCAGHGSHPLLARDRVSGKTALCVIASDTGLCSTYNHNIIASAKAFIESAGRDNVILIAVGKEALRGLKNRGYTAGYSYTNARGRYTKELSAEITGTLIDIYTKNEADDVHVLHAHFASTIRNKPVIEKFLGIEPDASQTDNFIVEPSAAALLSSIIPRYIEERMRLILLDAFSSEHASRMVAMKTAKENADELIDTLTLQRNNIRQAAITKEILEIAMSAEALKG